jgi:hypothetical protein
VFVEKELKEALCRLNPDIAANPDRADEVIHKLRAILITVNNVGLVRANEEFAKWLRNEVTLPIGNNNEHVASLAGWLLCCCLCATRQRKKQSQLMKKKMQKLH